MKLEENEKLTFCRKNKDADGGGGGGWAAGKEKENPTFM